MAEVQVDTIERAQLCDTLNQLGPDAPTLLQPWTTRDLAAHLALREHDPLAGPGLVLPGPWGRFAERRQAALALRDFSWLVTTIRSEPRGFFNLGWVRRFPTLNELFVHHEDARRANGLGPRTTDDVMDEALWDNVCRSAWFLARRLKGAGLEIRRAETAETVRARRGETTALITGAPGELLLYLFGRRRAARVEMSGPALAVDALHRARFGM